MALGIDRSLCLADEGIRRGLAELQRRAQLEIYLL